MSLWEQIVVVLYMGLLGVICLVAVHRLRLAFAARHLRVTEPEQPEELPEVLVQLPVFNERYVVRRLVDAVCALEYPREKLCIQILDDSTDDTLDITRSLAEIWRERGVNIVQVTRDSRTGFKAGALAEGLRQNHAELVAVFDADFVPEPDFLLRLVPHFTDPEVGMVQARWGHLNRDQSILTQAQAILLDGHFLNESAGRAAHGLFFNFNGTAGMWRRSCIDDAGGWLARSLTEDLDLSYRAQLRGWRFVFRPDVVVPAELPPDPSAFKSQQFRWAKGSLETARYLLPEIWRSPHASLVQRVEATAHLLANMVYPFVLTMALLMPFAMAVRIKNTAWPLMALDFGLLVGSTGSFIAFYVAASKAAGLKWGALKQLPVALAIGSGLAINNGHAVWQALRGRWTPFLRTPKFGGNPVKGTRYAPPVPWQAILELLLGFYVLSAVAIAGWGERYLAMPFLGLFAGGFLLLGWGVGRGARSPGIAPTQREAEEGI